MAMRLGTLALLTVFAAAIVLLLRSGPETRRVVPRALPPTAAATSVHAVAGRAADAGRIVGRLAGADDFHHARLVVLTQGRSPDRARLSRFALPDRGPGVELVPLIVRSKDFELEVAPADAKRHANRFAQLVLTAGDLEGRAALRVPPPGELVDAGPVLLGSRVMFRGRVVSPERAPVAGARIHVRAAGSGFCVDGDAPADAAAVTDDEGAFALALPAPVALVVHAAGFLPLWIPSASPREANESAVLVLERSRTVVRGRIELVGASPDSCEAVLEGTDYDGIVREAPLSLDSDGVFSSDRIGPGVYTLRISGGTWSHSGPEYQVAAGDNALGSVRLDLTGRVRIADAEGGLRAGERIPLSAYTSHGSWFGIAVVGAAGVAVGEHVPREEIRWVNVVPSERYERVECLRRDAEDGSPLLFRFTPRRESTAMRVLLRDAAGTLRPLARASFSGPGASGATDDDGRFGVAAPPGKRIGITFIEPATGDRWSWTGPAGGDVVVEDARTCTLILRLVDDRGEPVPDTRVEADARGVVRAGWTDAHGAVRLRGMPPGSKVRVRGDGWSAEDVAVPDDAVERAADVVLPGRAVTGRAVDADGNPRGGVRLFLRVAATHAFRGGECITSAHGRWRFFAVARDRYVLVDGDGAESAPFTVAASGYCGDVRFP